MRILGLCLMLLFSPALLAAAPAPKYDAGIDYKLIDPAQPTDTNDKVQVIELFWYGCPHCFHFEPNLEAWAKHKPAYVEFERIPAILSPRWEPLARAYYTAQVLGVLKKTHLALFDAIHLHGQRFPDEDSLVPFFAKYGVSEKDFRNAWDSFAVSVKVNYARDMTQRYGIDGVPAMVVDGKYRTDGSLAGGNDNMLNIIDFLVNKERTARHLTAAAGS